MQTLKFWKISFLFLFFSVYSFVISAQCTECPSGSTIVTGSTNITDQNNAINYCITGVWTGSINGIGNNSTVTICPSAVWEIPASVTLQQNIDIFNFGTITDNSNMHLFKIQGQTELTNNSSGSIEVTLFENQDTDFINHGSLIAEDIYFHGPVDNFGNIESTASCGGDADVMCGFFIGNKGQALNNMGSVTTVDATLADAVLGGGTFISTGVLNIQNNSASLANNFITNDLEFQASSVVNTGTFIINGEFFCNNASVSTIVCLEDASGTQMNDCSNSSVPIVPCSVLPVDFISFDVKQNEENLIFSWEVGEETNVSHYEILHSPNGENFRAFAEIEAKQEHFYQHVQKGLGTVFSYFKIRSIDFDGTIGEFDKVLILRNEDALSFSISPNPVLKNGELNIVFEKEMESLIELYDLSGKKIQSKFFNDSTNIQLLLDKIQNSGLYLVKVVTPNGVVTKEIFIH